MVNFISTFTVIQKCININTKTRTKSLKEIHRIWIFAEFVVHRLQFVFISYGMNHKINILLAFMSKYDYEMSVVVMKRMNDMININSIL